MTQVKMMTQKNHNYKIKSQFKKINMTLKVKIMVLKNIIIRF